MILRKKKGESNSQTVKEHYDQKTPVSEEATKKSEKDDQVDKNVDFPFNDGSSATNTLGGSSRNDNANTEGVNEAEKRAIIEEAKATIATMIKNGERDLDKIKKTDAFKQLKKTDRYIVSRIVDPKNGLGPDYKDMFKLSDLSSIKTMVNNTPISGWADIVTLSENIEDKLKDIVLSKGGTIK